MVWGTVSFSHESPAEVRQCREQSRHYILDIHTFTHAKSIWSRWGGGVTGTVQGYAAD